MKKMQKEMIFYIEIVLFGAVYITRRIQDNKSSD